MITHKIEKYKANFLQQHHHNHYPQRVHWQPKVSYTPQQAMQKHEFNAYMATVPFKKGDYIVNDVAGLPYTLYEVYRVVGLDEAVLEVSNWGTADSGPHAIQACGHAQRFISKLGTKRFKKIPWMHVPNGWSTEYADPLDRPIQPAE